MYYSLTNILILLLYNIYVFNKSIGNRKVIDLKFKFKEKCDSLTNIYFIRLLTKVKHKSLYIT